MASQPKLSDEKIGRFLAVMNDAELDEFFKTGLLPSPLPDLVLVNHYSIEHMGIMNHPWAELGSCFADVRSNTYKCWLPHWTLRCYPDHRAWQ